MFLKAIISKAMILKLIAFKTMLFKAIHHTEMSNAFCTASRAWIRSK